MSKILMLRPAQASDRDSVFAMVATVWDGSDYIPKVWDEWLADAAGQLLVGELDGRVVALAKLTELEPSDDWLEGVRIEPAVQSRGLGRALVQQCIAVSQQRGKRTLRWITGGGNTPMRRLCETLKIPLVAQPHWYSAPHLAGDMPLVPLAEEMFERVQVDLADSALLRFNHGMLIGSWEYRPLTASSIRLTLAAGEILHLPGEEGWIWVSLGSRGGWWVMHLSGTYAQQVALVRALRFTTETPATDMFVRAHVLDGAPHLAALEEAGLVRGEHSALVYEVKF